MRMNNELLAAMEQLIVIAGTAPDADLPKLTPVNAIALITEINNGERDFEMMFKMCNVLADMAEQFRVGGEAISRALKECEQALSASRAAHLSVSQDNTHLQRMIDENLTKISDQSKLLGQQSARIHTLEAEVDRLTAMTGIEVDELPQAGSLVVDATDDNQR